METWLEALRTVSGWMFTVGYDDPRFGAACAFALLAYLGLVKLLAYGFWQNKATLMELLPRAAIGLVLAVAALAATEVYLVPLVAGGPKPDLTAPAVTALRVGLAALAAVVATFVLKLGTGLKFAQALLVVLVSAGLAYGVAWGSRAVTEAALRGQQSVQEGQERRGVRP